MKIEKNNFVRGKLNYARGERPPVACILCAVAANDPQVNNLVLFRRNGINLRMRPAAAGEKPSSAPGAPSMSLMGLLTRYPIPLPARCRRWKFRTWWCASGKSSRP